MKSKGTKKTEIRSIVSKSKLTDKEKKKETENVIKPIGSSEGKTDQKKMGGS